MHIVNLCIIHIFAGLRGYPLLLHCLQIMFGFICFIYLGCIGWWHLVKRIYQELEVGFYSQWESIGCKFTALAMMWSIWPECRTFLKLIYLKGVGSTSSIIFYHVTMHICVESVDTSFWHPLDAKIKYSYYWWLKMGPKSIKSFWKSKVGHHSAEMGSAGASQIWISHKLGQIIPSLQQFLKKT